MPAKVMLWGVLIIMMLSIFVVVVDKCMLLSLKFDFNAYCRAALLKMENENGLSPQERNNLQTKLANKGFTNITITAPMTVMQGQDLNIRVEAEYSYRRLTSIYSDRINTSQRMIYDKTSMARRVIN